MLAKNVFRGRADLIKVRDSPYGVISSLGAMGLGPGGWEKIRVAVVVLRNCPLPHPTPACWGASPPHWRLRGMGSAEEFCAPRCSEHFCSGTAATQIRVCKKR